MQEETGAMTYRFTTGWAHVVVGLGLTLIILGVLLAVLVGVAPVPWTDQRLGTIEKISVAVTVLAAGVALGGSLIALGQLMLAFLNMRENLERLTHRLAGEDDVPCLYCGEAIKADATVCRYCRSDLKRPTAADRLLTPR
jgi:hypothetical protein